jgi:hypothetical protein
MLCALKVGYQFIPQCQVATDVAHDPKTHKDVSFLSHLQKISFGPQGNITLEKLHNLAMASANDMDANDRIEFAGHLSGSARAV